MAGRCRRPELSDDPVDRACQSFQKHQFDFDVREFAESPQIASYDAAKGGHIAWYSDIGLGPAAGSRKRTLVLQLSNPGSYDGGDLEIRPSA